MLETWVQSLGQEDPLEEEMATHSSILAWRIPRTEEPGELQSMGSQRVGHSWTTNTNSSYYLFTCILSWMFLRNTSECKLLSCVRLFMTLWTVACQAPLSMEFSWPGYWRGKPLPCTGDLPNPGIEPRSPTLQADSLPSELPGKSKKQET